MTFTPHRDLRMCLSFLRRRPSRPAYSQNQFGSQRRSVGSFRLPGESARGDRRMHLIAGTSAGTERILDRPTRRRRAPLRPARPSRRRASCRTRARQIRAARMTMCPSPIATNSRGTERSQPRSLSHPVMQAPRPRSRADSRRSDPTAARDRPTGPANTGNPSGAFRQVGHDGCAAEAPAVGGADHQHDQRLQRHRHVGQRQIDLGR